MIGYVNEDYNEYLKEKDYKTEKDGTFYYYFRAIEKGSVYTLHKDCLIAERDPSFLKFAAETNSTLLISASLML